jgi:hypothetical protein
MSATAASAALAYGSAACPAGPVEQRLAEFAFQPLDLGADGRLRDVDALSGAGEIGLLGDRDEIFELPQFHSR